MSGPQSTVLIEAVDFGVLPVASFAGVAKTAAVQRPTTSTIISRVAISGRWCLVCISSNACCRRALYHLASRQGFRGPQMKIVDIQVHF